MYNINSVQNRATRFFLGTGKYTPTTAISGDMGWIPPSIKQWETISRPWVRNIHTNDTRLNKQIFNWARQKANSSYKNCCFFHDVAPSKLETGRYEGISEIDRHYPFCRDSIEDEVMFYLSALLIKILEKS